jgi:protein TonB
MARTIDNKWKWLCAALFFYCSIGAFAQKQNLHGQVVYLHVDKMPSFPGGSHALQLFLDRNLKWPQREMDVQGTVLISFIIDKSGKVDKVRIEKSIIPEFDNEAKRVMLLMPKWKPGELNGRKVATLMYLPVQFMIK